MTDPNQNTLLQPNTTMGLPYEWSRHPDSRFGRWMCTPTDTVESRIAGSATGSSMGAIGTLTTPTALLLVKQV